MSSDNLLDCSIIEHGDENNYVVELKDGSLASLKSPQKLDKDQSYRFYKPTKLNDLPSFCYKFSPKKMGKNMKKTTKSKAEINSFKKKMNESLAESSSAAASSSAAVQDQKVLPLNQFAEDSPEVSDLVLKVVEVSDERHGLYGKYIIVQLRDTEGSKARTIANKRRMNDFKEGDILKMNKVQLTKEDDKHYKISLKQQATITILNDEQIISKFINVNAADFVLVKNLIGTENCHFYKSCRSCHKKIPSNISENCLSCKSSFSDNPPVNDFRVDLLIEDNNDDLITIRGFKSAFKFENNDEEQVKKWLEEMQDKSFTFQFNEKKNKYTEEMEYILLKIAPLKKEDAKH